MKSNSASDESFHLSPLLHVIKFRRFELTTHFTHFFAALRAGISLAPKFAFE